MPEDCASLRLRLLFEYARFLDWGDVAGLSDVNDHNRFDLSLRASRPMIFAALSELQARLQRLTKIGLSFEEMQQVDDAMTGGRGTVNLRERDLVTRADMKPFKDKLDSQDAVLPGKRRSKGISLMIRAYKSTKDVATHPKRLRWAMIDKERFEQHLQKIKELTDFLHELLGDSKMHKLLEQSRETGLGIMQLNTGQQELKALLMAATLVPRSYEDDAGSILSQATTIANDQYVASIPAPFDGSTTTFEQLTRFRLQRLQIETQYKTDHSIEVSFERLQLGVESSESNDAKEHDDVRSVVQQSSRGGASPSRQFGRLVTLDNSADIDTQSSTEIWVEWKEYDEVHTVVSANDPIPTRGPANATKQRVEQLVMLLKGKNPPAEFRIPDCVGYCRDVRNARFGFIYESHLTSAIPQTLRQLLSRTPASLKSRIRTARDLATSVLFLHAVGWLHKDLRSDNIIFSEGSLLPDLPSLQLAGFGYARPDETDLTTKGKNDIASAAVYRHPDYQGLTPKRFRKTFDYYSLGIILLELALWQAADVVLAQDSRLDSSLMFSTDSSSIKTKHVRTNLLRDQLVLDQVRLRMGDHYARATESCIIGLDAFGLEPSVDETDPTVNTILQLEFLHIVVNELRSITV
jgi:hypothetical protein